MAVVKLNDSYFSQLENVTVSGTPFICEIGKIKIGNKGEERTSSKTGKTFRLPQKLDHFIITTNFKDPHTDTFVPDVALMEQIASATNQDPNNLKFLPVMLLFDNPELNFIVRFSCYKSAKAWCIGDGKKAFRLKNNYEREEVQCPCERVLPSYNGNEKCKVFGRLTVLLQGVKRIGGCWVFRTTSWHTVRSIQSSMIFLRQLTGGILSGIPLMLTINPKAVIIPDGSLQTIYVVNLEYWGDIESLQEHAIRIQKRRIEYKLKTEMLEEQLRKSLPAIQFDEDEEDIFGEFYPENWAATEKDQSETEPEPHNKQSQPTEAQQQPEQENQEKQKESAESNESKPQQESSESKEVLTLW